MIRKYVTETGNLISIFSIFKLAYYTGSQKWIYILKEICLTISGLRQGLKIIMDNWLG